MIVCTAVTMSTSVYTFEGGSFGYAGLHGWGCLSPPDLWSLCHWWSCKAELDGVLVCTALAAPTVSVGGWWRCSSCCTFAGQTWPLIVGSSRGPWYPWLGEGPRPEHCMLMSEMKACSLSCTEQWCRFLRSKPMMLFALEDTICVCFVQLRIEPHPSGRSPKTPAAFSCCRVFWSTLDFMVRYNRQSSAKRRTCDVTCAGRSLINNRNSSGPRTLTWGTPDSTGA